MIGSSSWDHSPNSPAGLSAADLSPQGCSACWTHVLYAGHIADPPDYADLVPAADRALTLLELLAGSTHGLTSAEILEHVGGSRSGLYALLNTLRSRGYVETDEGSHRVGPALWSLIPTPPVALESLVDHFRVETMDNPCPESVALAWPDGEGTVVVSASPADQPVRVSYDIGERRPSSAVDSAVIMAGEPGNGPDLDTIRRDGYGLDEGDELVEMAAPICRDGVLPIASLLVGIPAQRASQDRREAIVAWLRSAGAHLSHRVGANTYQPYGWSTGQPIEPSSEMSDAELDRFLGGLWSAQLGCVRNDGTPHVVPLWYEWDGAALWLAASPGASWRQHIAIDPKVSITLDEPWPPLRRVFIAGSAQQVGESEVPGGVAGLRSRLATRYLGRGADSQPELIETEGWGAVRVTPERMHGRRGLGSTEKGRAK